MLFHGYNPYHQNARAEEPTIPLYIHRLAWLIGAEYLSKDGQRAYMQRYGAWYEAEYCRGSFRFGSWWLVDAPPDGAVKVEDLK